MGGIARVNKIFERSLYPYHRHPDGMRRITHHPLIIGAGPVGLCAAIDLAQRNVPVVVDDSTRSLWQCAICFAKRLGNFDRLGVDQLVKKGVR